MFFVAASSKKAVILSSLRDHDEIPMKYQQLENLECGWKWKYLVKKHREGELITRHLELSAAQAAVDKLLMMENNPVDVNDWISQHIHPELDNRLKQTIRARRKRHFNAEHQHTRKNPSIWNIWSGSGWPAWRNGATAPCLKRLCS